MEDCVQKENGVEGEVINSYILYLYIYIYLYILYKLAQFTEQLSMIKTCISQDSLLS